MNRPDGHRCAPKDLVYDPPGPDNMGARCEVCDRRWRITRTTDGKVIGYLTPPTTPAERRKTYAGWWE